MNRLRAIRIALVGILVLLILILLFSFRQPSSNQNEHSPDGSRTVAETVTEETALAVTGGEQILYREGAPYAVLSFRQAVQKEEGMEVEDAVIHWNEQGVYLQAERAVLLEHRIRFLKRVAIGTDERTELSLEPPVEYLDGILRGNGTASLSQANRVLTGTGFVVDVDDQRVLMKNDVSLSDGASGHMTARARYAVVDLKLESVDLLSHVQFTLNQAEIQWTGEADALNLGPKGRISTTGRSRIRKEGLQIAGTWIVLTPQDHGYTLASSEPVFVEGEGTSIAAPVLVPDEQELTFPHAVIRSKNGWISVGSGGIMPANGTLRAVNPFGKISGHQLSGTSLTASLRDAHTEIEAPRIQDPQANLYIQGTTLTSGEREQLILEGPVYGHIGERDLIATLARFVPGKWRFEGITVYDNDWNLMIQGDDSTYAGGRYDMKGNVTFQRFLQEERVVRMDANSVSGDFACMQLTGDIRVTDGILSLAGPRGYATRNHFSVMDPTMTGPDIDHAVSKVAFLPVRESSMWMFGNVEVKDNKGNWIHGGKLTFDHRTGRISVYEDSETVRIKLHL